MNVLCLEETHFNHQRQTSTEYDVNQHLIKWLIITWMVMRDSPPATSPWESKQQLLWFLLFTRVCKQFLTSRWNSVNELKTWSVTGRQEYPLNGWLRMGIMSQWLHFQLTGDEKRHLCLPLITFWSDAVEEQNGLLGSGCEWHGIVSLRP